MTKEFKNWLIWTGVSVLSSFVINSYFFYHQFSFAVALSLVESVVWAIFMIPIAIMNTKLFEK